MNVLKYNNAQLSIFDFQKARDSRAEFLTKLKDLLGLEEERHPKKMLEACCINPSKLSTEQRHFVHDMAILHFDGKDLTEKQSRYLFSLYRICSNQ